MRVMGKVLVSAAALGLVLGLAAAPSVATPSLSGVSATSPLTFVADKKDDKKDDVKKTEDKKADVKKTEEKKADAKKTDAKSGDAKATDDKKGKKAKKVKKGKKAKKVKKVAKKGKKSTCGEGKYRSKKTHKCVDAATHPVKK